MTLYHSHRRPVDYTENQGRSRTPSSTRRGRWIRALSGRFARFVLFLLALALCLGTAVLLHERGAFDRQSQRNHEVLEQIVLSLESARAIAVATHSPVYWTQSALGRGDQPYMDGSVWHIDIASDTGGMMTVSRGGIDILLGVGVHCPGAEVGFDGEGHLRNGAISLRVDSSEPGQPYFIDLAADGSITTHGTRG